MVELGLDYRLRNRPGLPVSVGLHILLLGWGLLWLPASKPLEPPPVEALPVEIVSDLQAAAAGSVSAPDKGKPAPEKFTPAKANPDSVKPGAAEKDMETPPTPPVAKPPAPASNDAPPPPPRPEIPKETPKEPPKPPEPKPEPQKPPEKPVEAKPTPQDEKALSKLVDHDADAPPPPQKPKVEAKAEPKPPAKPAEKPPEKQAAKKSDADPLAAAEKLLDTPAKAGSGKTATAKATKFDADKLDAMLNRQSASGGGSRAQPQDASLGAASGTPSATLSASEVNALKRQIRACWNIPVAAKPGDDLKVRLSFSLNPDGSLSGQPEVLQAPRGDLSQVAAEAAMRAVAQCGPYTLPAEKYAAWKQNTINFDPSQFQ